VTPEVAAKTAAPTVVDLTVKTATPPPSVVAGLVMIVSVAPRLEARVTVALGIGLSFASLRATVIVELAKPSATTDVGAAFTVEFAALTAPAVNVTVAV